MLSALAAALAVSGSVVGATPAPAPPRVLLVADELPAMEVLAGQLRDLVASDCTITRQEQLPSALGAWSAVVVYIHGDLHERTERALIDYAEAGGTLVALHHSISSGKRRNRDWFRFLGVSLPEGDVSRGGYKWTEGVTVTYVRLAARHRVTTRGVKYPDVRAGRRRVAGRERDVPGFTLHDSEVYLNHVLTGRRTLLLGLDHTDAAGTVYRQDTAGWVKRAGKGTVYYFMPGHHAAEFAHPTYARILANAVTSGR